MSVINSGSSDRSIKLWNLEAKKVICNLTENLFNLRSVTISSDGQIIVSADNKGIKLWNVKTQQAISSFSSYGSVIESVAID